MYDIEAYKRRNRAINDTIGMNIYHTTMPVERAKQSRLVSAAIALSTYSFRHLVHFVH